MLVCSMHVSAQTITNAEYFFDNDPGIGMGTALTISAPAASVTESYSISTTGLSPGFHKLYIRVKDSDDLWSLAAAQTLLTEVVPTSAANVVAGEYFFNTDPGLGNGTALSFSAGTSVNHSFTASVSGLSSGFNELFVRTQDDLGHWSLAERRTFFILTDPPVATQINAAEYYFDTDPGFGSGTALTITPAGQLDQTFNLPLTGLSPGFHKIYVRVQDDLNQWSQIEARDFFVEATPGPTATIVAAAEYFIDADPGIGAGTPITLSATTAEINEQVSIPLTGVSQGFHTLSIRVQDDLGLWSMVMKRSFFVFEDPASQPQPMVVSAAEFFFDTDPGVGNGTAISLSQTAAEIEESIAVAVPATVGEHELFIRVQDDLGRWSIAERRSFEIFTGPVSNDNTLVTDEDVSLAIAEADFNFDSDGTTFTRVVIETIPNFGVLDLSGTPVTNGLEIAVADIANLTYIPSANANGDDPFTFTVGDDVQLSQVTSTMTISVTPINDPPSFSTSGDITVDQDFTVAQFVSVTPDAVPSDEFTEMLTYTLSPPAVTFANVSIDAVTGLVTITSAPGQVGMQEFTITADDGEAENNTFQQMFTLTVQVPNEPPVIVDQSFTVDENLANDAVVGVIAASDADDDPLNFTITAGNSLGGFAVNSTTQELTVADGSVLNFELQSTFVLTIQVDDGTDVASANVTVNLNDINDAPSIDDQQFSIPENSANGTFVGFVFATDEDDTGITFGIESGNELGGFALNPSNGELTVANQGVLDFETNPSFSLEVYAMDASLMTVSTVTVDLTDEAELGVGDLNSVTFYPNPVTSIIHLEIEEEVSEVRLYDMGGKMIKELDVKNRSHDLSNVKSGTYLLQVLLENGEKQASRVVIQH